ncbi:hypothetical protein K490DRAFT_62466 [Saccharata proteae CBS 121410]|uniref:Uncharacterized protein n=1 Tax=Saccharata proteae CBS 121410 TaxID=1314787 RepID=A0A9P4I257_9PEZI|nr:hypothetical protein K490DRAFT_62466 [Saccharata proteae CBS 121410]
MASQFDPAASGPEFTESKYDPDDMQTDVPGEERAGKTTSTNHVTSRRAAVRSSARRHTLYPRLVGVLSAIPNSDSEEESVGETTGADHVEAQGVAALRSVENRQRQEYSIPRLANAQTTTPNTESEEESDGETTCTDHVKRRRVEAAPSSVKNGQGQRSSIPKPTNAQSATPNTEPDEENDGEDIGTEHINSHTLALHSSIRNKQRQRSSTPTSASAQSATPGTQQVSEPTFAVHMPVPDEFLRFAALVKDPPPEGIWRNGQLTRVWFAREFAPHMNNALCTLSKDSPIYKLGRERLGLGEKIWDFLTKTAVSTVRCDEPVALSPDGHSQDVARCQGTHGQQGGLVFDFCRHCYENQARCLSRKAQDALFEGWVTPCCEDCERQNLYVLHLRLNAQNRTVFCQCDLGEYCLRCQQAHLERMTDAVKAWPSHGPSRMSPDISIRYCLCGSLPAANPRLFRCASCRRFKVKRSDFGKPEEKASEEQDHNAPRRSRRNKKRASVFGGRI